MILWLNTGWECHGMPCMFFIVVSGWRRLKHRLESRYFEMEHTAEATGIGTYLRNDYFFQQKWLHIILNDVEGF